MEIVSRVASERPVVIFSKTTCAMSSSIKRLFSGYGVNPAVLELDEMPKGREIERALTSQIGCSPVVPAVFIGGELVRYKPGPELDLLLSFQAFVKKWF